MQNSRFNHKMIREILEEPHVVEKTIRSEESQIRKIAQEISSEEYEMIYITGSGTSYHSGLASQYALSNLSNLITSIIPSSEFHRWIPAKISQKVLLIAISQSGESSDVLKAVSAGQSRGMPLLAVTNTPQSSLAEMSDWKITPRSGLEEAIPATKSYITQLISIFMLASELAKYNILEKNLDKIKGGIQKTPKLIGNTLSAIRTTIKDISWKYRDRNIIFLLGSGPNFATALEGALKLKETCTIFAEGFATREFLHGPMRLVDKRALIITLFSPDEVNTASQINNDFRSYGASIMIISEESPLCLNVNQFSDDMVLVSKGLPKVFSPILYVIPLQLLAYYGSVFRGLNPDSPEKISKVVR